MQIRRARIEDLDEIAAIEKECFPEAEAASKASIEKRLEAFSDHFWLLEHEGRVISFVNGMVTDEPDLTDDMYDDADMHREDGDWQMIFGVDTLPDYRNCGYAGQVLRHVIEEARSQKRKGLVLTCKERLVHYYASFGFEDEGLSRSTHGNVRWYQMRLRF